MYDVSIIIKINTIHHLIACYEYIWKWILYTTNKNILLA